MNPTPEQDKKPYVAPSVAQLVIDPVREMLAVCSGTGFKQVQGGSCGTVNS